MKAITTEDEARFRKLLGKPKTYSGSFRGITEEELQQWAKELAALRYGRLRRN